VVLKDHSVIPSRPRMALGYTNPLLRIQGVPSASLGQRTPTRNDDFRLLITTTGLLSTYTKPRPLPSTYLPIHHSPLDTRNIRSYGQHPFKSKNDT